MVYSSVLDPDAKRDPDLYVFGPPGSIVYLYGFGFRSESSSKSKSFHQQAKHEEKPSFPLYATFLSLKNDVNVPLKRNKHNNIFLLMSRRGHAQRMPRTYNKKISRWG
jgi:hypothetical protein